MMKTKMCVHFKLMAYTFNFLSFTNYIPLTFAFIAKPDRLKLFWLTYKLNSCIRLKGRKRRSSNIESSTGRSSGGSRRGSRSTSKTLKKKPVVSLRVMCLV